MIDIIKGLVGSFGASLFFSLLFHAPKRCVPVSSIVGMVGYAVYLGTLGVLESEIIANFVAALGIAVLSEVTARIQKAPAIIYSLIGMVPLVPGAGLYRTMLALVLEDYSGAVQLGVRTLFNAGAIAMGIAIVSAISRKKASK